MPELTPEEQRVLAKLLVSSTIRNLMGAEEWDLTEEEEMTLWGVIDRTEAPE